MEHLYTKTQAEQLREKLIKNAIMPLVEANFNKNPQLNSATMLVAQYWDDEASDAVHQRLIYSVLDTPNIEAASIAQKDCTEDVINLLNLSSEYGELEDEVCFIDVTEIEDEDEADSYWWPDNFHAIPAFAAFCKEDCHQGMDTFEAYTPYAIFRRRDDDIEIEVVGEMLRPWLDGIKPGGE